MSDDKFTILIVDDTPENIDILAAVLGTDYRVKAALGGEQALKIAKGSKSPDLILLDIMMPGIDGFEVCKRLKNDPRTGHIPVIFVTARMSATDEAKGFDLGAVDYITKPISPPVVLARVQTHLALYDQNRELDKQVRAQTKTIHDTQLKIIQRLGRAAEFKDDATGMHVIRMSHYAKILGLAAGMTESMAELLMDAAPMHDIGKIGVPDRILQKEGVLDDQEWALMQTHAQIGAEIIGEDQSELLQLARTVAISHHEHWDGSGYPNGLAGDDIPLVGRIVAIADVFDALTSARPYKTAWSVEKALEHLQQQAGSQFDAKLVTLFIDNIEAVLECKLRFSDN